MTPPRHLWSGDWQRESAEAAERRTRRVGPSEPIAEPTAEAQPARPSALERLRTALRSASARLAALRGANTRRARRTALMAVAMLLSAAAAYAVVSALLAPDAKTSASAEQSSLLSRAPAWLGVDLASFPLGGGAVIVDVSPGSPAAAAGLEPGDVITEIDNQPVQAPSELESVLAGLHAGQRVQIAYQRGPSVYTTQVTLQGRHSGP